MVARVREGSGATCSPLGIDMSTERGSESLTGLEKEQKKDGIGSRMKTYWVRAWNSSLMIKCPGEAGEARFGGRGIRCEAEGSGENCGRLLLSYSL